MVSESNRPARRPGEAAFPPRVLGPLAISHVAVLPMETSDVLQDQTVVIEHGVIRAIAPSASVEVAGMQVVDGTGRYLMPGLTDVHAHYGDTNLAGLFLANGITQVRNMWGQPFHLALEQMVARGDFPGPRVATTSPIVDGLGVHGQTAWPGSLALTEPEDAGPLVQRLVRRGYQQIKAYQWLTPAVLRALGQASARAGVRMTGHCPDGISFAQAIEAGMGCFEHLTGIAAGLLREGRRFPSLRDPVSRRGTPESLELIAHHLDYDAVRRLAHEMAARDVWNCPTLVVWQRQNQGPEEALADPDLRYMEPGTVRGWDMMNRGRFAALPCSREEWLALARARDEALARIVGILHEEGAPLLLGTDTPNPFVVYGFSIHQEIANLVAAGLSPYAALRCGTVEAARFLGQSATAGTVAAGKRADLILLRANPLRDVGAVRELEAVFVNGHHFTRAELDGLLKQRLAALTAPPRPVRPELSEGDGGAAVREGTLQEQLAGTPIGLVGYRRSGSAEEGWQVEEHAVIGGGRGGNQQRRTRLWLAPDWTVRRAETEAETAVGRESAEIAWSEEGAYRVRVTAPDGYVSESIVPGPPLLPSERLARSVLSHWLASQPAPTTAQVLGIEYEVGQVAGVAAASVPAETGGASSERGVTWEVTTTRPGEVTTQTYRLAEDGELLGVHDMLFGAPHELVPEPAPVA